MDKEKDSTEIWVRLPARCPSSSRLIFNMDSENDSWTFFSQPSTKANKLESTKTTPCDPKAPRTFPKFKELPFEIRIKIWGLVPHIPIIVRPAKSGSPVHMRTVPSVLQACRESREEYLDTGKPGDEVSLARKMKEHQVYKLYSVDSDDSPAFLGAGMPLIRPVGVDILYAISKLAMIWN